MAQIYVIGEDVLCCALGSRLVHEVLGWSLAQPPVNAAGVTKLKANLHRYVGLARVHPVLCIADTDGACAPTMLSDWVSAPLPERFLLRLAVKESESWLMADQEAFSDFLNVPEAKIPSRPDDVPDAKLQLLGLARRSRKRPIREEVVSARDPNKPGTGYNIHMCDFISSRWRPAHAALRSPSLARAMKRLSSLRA